MYQVHAILLSQTPQLRTSSISCSRNLSSVEVALFRAVFGQPEDGFDGETASELAEVCSLREKMREAFEDQSFDLQGHAPSCCCDGACRHEPYLSTRGCLASVQTCAQDQMRLASEPSALLDSRVMLLISAAAASCGLRGFWGQDQAEYSMPCMSLIIRMTEFVGVSCLGFSLR